MLHGWKRKFLVVLLAGLFYAGCNTQSMLITEAFFREEIPDLAVSPKVCYMLGSAAYETFRYNLAIEIIDRNLSDFPYEGGATKAEYLRAKAYDKLGKYDKAITLYEDFLFRHPKSRRYRSIQNRIATLRMYRHSPEA